MNLTDLVVYLREMATNPANDTVAFLDLAAENLERLKAENERLKRFLHSTETTA